MKSRQCFSRHFLLVAALAVWAALPVPARVQDVRGLALENRQTSPNRYYALLIGNNAYQHLRPLKTAEDDAREVERVLSSRYGFQTKLLLNATRQQIISTLNAYRRELDAGSSLLIYYAGHGYNDREADKAYWLPIDADPEDNSNWISADDITTNIKTIPSAHVLIVSDSCYSGTLTRGLGAFPLGTPATRQRYLEKMMAGKSRTLMASGGNEPVADGGGSGHSVFANALLRGLTQSDKEEFTADELFRSYIQESVAGGANQTPEYSALRNSGHDSGDFVFARQGGTGVAVGAHASPLTKATQGAPRMATGGAANAPAPGTKSTGSIDDAVAEAKYRDASLTGSTWFGNSLEAGEYRVEFLQDGQLHYIINVRQNGTTSPKTVNGRWRQSGSNVQITIDGYSVWQGVFDGNSMKGEASNQEGLKWNWVLFKQD